TGGEVLGHDVRVRSAKTSSVNEVIPSPFYKRSEIKDTYNEMVLRCRGDYGIIFRVYNEGVAYRFFTNRKNDFTVQNEQANFNFKADYSSFVPYVNAKEHS